MLFADLLSLNLVTFLMFFILVNISMINFCIQIVLIISLM